MGPDKRLNGRDRAVGDCRETDLKRADGRGNRNYSGLLRIQNGTRAAEPDAGVPHLNAPPQGSTL